MQNPRTSLRLVASARVAALALTVGAVGTYAQTPGTPVSDASDPNKRVLERILVKVNGEIITQSNLEDRQVAAIRARGVQPSTNAELFQLLSEVTPEAIATMVEELLLVERGRELGYQLSDTQFRDFLDNLKAENGFETDEEFEQTLQQQEGMTLPDFRRLVERQMLASQVQQVAILNRVSITDVEAREYYDTNIDEFTAPASATLREILFEVPETDGAGLMADQQARARAEDALALLAAGEDFAELAGEVSDSPSKANGGLIGPFLISDMSETIREVVGALDVGGISETMRTPQGYQILMLEARTDSVAQPFEEVRDQISENVFNDRRLEEYRKFLDGLREEAIIEWMSEELKEAYDEYLSRVPVAAPPR